MSLVLDPANPSVCLARTAVALASLDIGGVAKVLNCTMLSACDCRCQCLATIERSLDRFPADPLCGDGSLRALLSRAVS